MAQTDYVFGRTERLSQMTSTYHIKKISNTFKTLQQISGSELPQNYMKNLTD